MRINLDQGINKTLEEQFREMASQIAKNVFP